MNIIVYETKTAIKSSLIWLISMLALYSFYVLGAFSIFMDSKQEVITLLENYPPEFINAFGMDVEKLFSFSGFYNFTFIYISLMAAIMALSLSIGSFSREKRNKCLDFLLTKPTTRTNIFIKKLLSCIIVVVITNIIYLVFTLITYSSENVSSDLGTFILAMSGLFFTQLVFLSIGVVVATFSKKIRSVAGTATALGFGAFILSAIANIFSDKHIEYFAPLKYFEPHIVFENGGYDLKLVFVAIFIIIMGLGISYMHFCKSDAQSF